MRTALHQTASKHNIAVMSDALMSVCSRGSLSFHGDGVVMATIVVVTDVPVRACMRVCYLLFEYYLFE